MSAAEEILIELLPPYSPILILEGVFLARLGIVVSADCGGAILFESHCVGKGSPPEASPYPLNTSVWTIQVEENAGNLFMTRSEEAPIYGPGAVRTLVRSLGCWLEVREIQSPTALSRHHGSLMFENSKFKRFVENQ